MKIKISLVSYLNSKPFLYGMELSGLIDDIELHLDAPSECARKVITGEVDLGLIPVAVIPKVRMGQVITDYCIGADGPVKTVCLYSQVPISNLTKIMLDYESRTSILLLKFLLDKHWKVSPDLVLASEGYESKIHSTVGALVIGDRAIALGDDYPYVYDLAAAWKQFTGMPFVFAAWVANKPLPDEFVKQLDEALGLGVDLRAQVAEGIEDVPHPDFSVRNYYLKNISYDLDERKKTAMNFFVDMIRSGELKLDM
jgi:chorismate dehydratase